MTFKAAWECRAAVEGLVNIMMCRSDGLEVADRFTHSSAAVIAGFRVQGSHRRLNSELEAAVTMNLQ